MNKVYCIIILLFLQCDQQAEKQTEEEKVINVEQSKVIYKQYNKIIDGIGKVDSESKSTLSFEQPGQLDKIYTKVISVPCMELFELQSKRYRDKILNETKLKISIEAGSSDCWKKYVGDFGLTYGIDDFGKSAPYKEIYKHFGLIDSNIARKSKKLIKNMK